MTDQSTPKARPPGAGLGPCPTMTRSRGGWQWVCGCFSTCRVCGFSKHAAVHLHVMGEKPGDPPYDHEFAPRRP